MQQIAFRRDDRLAEIEEFLGQRVMAGPVERTGDQRPIAWPHVAVGIAGKLRDVIIVGSNHRAAVVDLRADDQQAAFIQPYNRFWQIGKDRRVGIQPQHPVAARPIQITFNMAFAHHVIKQPHIFKSFANRHPVINSRSSRRAKISVQRDGRIDAALGHGVAAERAIFSIAPGPLLAVNFLDADRPLIDSFFCGTFWEAVDQEPAILLVMDQRPAQRFVIGRITDCRFEDVKIVMEKQPYLARLVTVLADHEPADKERLVKINRIGRHNGHTKPIVAHLDFGQQRFMLVTHPSLPGRVAEPAELPAAAIRLADPQPRMGHMPDQVVFLPDMGVIQVAQAVIAIEVDKQRAIANRQITGHRKAFLSACRQSAADYSRSLPTASSDLMYGKVNRRPKFCCVCPAPCLRCLL